MGIDQKLYLSSDDFHFLGEIKENHKEGPFLIVHIEICSDGSGRLIGSKNVNGNYTENRLFQYNKISDLKSYLRSFPRN